MVEGETGSICLEHEGQDVDLVGLVFGLQPGSELVKWEDRLPLSLAKLDAGPNEVSQLWFTHVPEPGSEQVDYPDNVIVPTEFEYDGENYEFWVALVDMRESIDQGDAVFLIHGSVAGKTQILRAILTPICQYP